MLAIISGLVACSSEPNKTDAELGLNPQQSRGRQVFRQDCAQCHYAYIGRDLHGPSLKGVFQKQFLSSGLPANNDRVRELITTGRGMMPGFGRVLTDQQMDDLLSYLHTL